MPLDTLPLSHLVLWIDSHLEGVRAQGQLGDVDPQTVDVVVVDVLAAGRDALRAVVLAVVLGLDALAVVVLQAEAGLVALGHAGARAVQDVEVGEDLLHHKK